MLYPSVYLLANATYLRRRRDWLYSAGALRPYERPRPSMYSTIAFPHSPNLKRSWYFYFPIRLCFFREGQWRRIGILVPDAQISNPWPPRGLATFGSPSTRRKCFHQPPTIVPPKSLKNEGEGDRKRVRQRSSTVFC